MLNHDLYILVKCIEKTKETIGRKFPEFASEQLGDLRLITATQVQQIVGLGVLPHLAALVSILVCLLIGDVMMRGEAAEIRRSLAISTAIRNAALAFLIVGTNFPGTPAVTIAFVFGLYSLIVGFTYGKLMTGADVQSVEA